MIGDIMAISRLRMATDGQGVTTLVLFFGCPLHCQYCANNFCHELEEEYMYVPRAAYSPEELVEVLNRDEIYYLMTDGGVTFGGGEPLLQSEFIHEVCKLTNPKWKKRIETCLNVPWRYVEPLLSDINEWIVDIKDMDVSIYRKYTGASNRNVKENLFRLRDTVPPEKIHIRIPHIPGFNSAKNVDESVQWIKDVMKVEPEIFDYMLLHCIGK